MFSARVQKIEFALSMHHNADQNEKELETGKLGCLCGIFGFSLAFDSVHLWKELVLDTFTFFQVHR